MKFVYFTALKYPSKKTEPFFHRQMAGVLAKILGEDFSYIVRGDYPTNLAHARPVSIHAPRRAKALWYFLALPYLVLSHQWNRKGTVIYSYDSFLLIALIFWRRLFRFKYSVMVEWAQTYEDWRDGYLARGSDYNVVVSRQLKQVLEKRYKVSSNRIVVAYGGVNLLPIEEARAVSREELRASLGLPEGFLVGHVGAFIAGDLSKGIDILVESLLHLPKDVKVVCVGGSTRDAEAYEALGRELGISDRALFISHQPFEKAVAYERALDILVIPVSLRGAFLQLGGLPMKVWEYLASGRPIVYTNLDLLKEALDGRGLVFTPDDPKDLARVIMGVASRWEEEERHASGNYQVAKSYTWDARAKNILNLVENGL